MEFLYKFLGNFFKSEDDRKKLVKIVVPSFAIQSTAVLLGLASNFMLARGLGAANYGVFTFAFSAVFPFISMASFGISVLVLREIPPLLANNKTGLLKGLHQWSLKVAIPTAVLLSLVLISSVYYLPLAFQSYPETSVLGHYARVLLASNYRIPIILSAIVVPFYGLMNYYSSSVRGLNKMLLSQMSDNIVRPGLFVLLIAILYFFTNNFNVISIIWVNNLAFAAGLIFAVTIFYKYFNVKGAQPEYEKRKWWLGLGSLTLFNGILSLDSRLDVLMLGSIKDSVQVGAFNIAHKIALTLFFFLSVMNTIIAPSISRLNAANEKERLQEILTKTVRWVVALSFPVGILIIVFSKWIMLYFGKDFEQGQLALIILCSVQLFSISCGPAGVVSIMTGNEKYNTIATVMGMIITIVLNLILTPTMGLTGTAIAAAVSIVIWNLYMVHIVKKRVGVYPWVYKLK